MIPETSTNVKAQQLSSDASPQEQESNTVRPNSITSESIQTSVATYPQSVNPHQNGATIPMATQVKNTQNLSVTPNMVYVQNSNAGPQQAVYNVQQNQPGVPVYSVPQNQPGVPVYKVQQNQPGVPVNQYNNGPVQAANIPELIAQLKNYAKFSLGMYVLGLAAVWPYMTGPLPLHVLSLIFSAIGIFNALFLDTKSMDINRLVQQLRLVIGFLITGCVFIWLEFPCVIVMALNSVAVIWSTAVFVMGIASALLSLANGCLLIATIQIAKEIHRVTINSYDSCCGGCCC